MALPRKPQAHCTYYNLPVAEIECGMVPLKCERMNYEGQCPPHCPNYHVFAGVVTCVR